MKNHYFAGAARILINFCSVLIAFLVAETLSKQQAGQYFFLYSLVMLFTNVGQFGTSQYIIPTLSKIKKTKTTLLTNVIAFSFFSTTISSIALLIIIEKNTHDFFLIINILTWTVCASISNIVSEILKNLQKYKSHFLSSGILSNIIILLFLLENFIKNKTLSINEVIQYHSTLSIITLAISGIYIIYSEKLRVHQIKKNFLKIVANQSTPFFLLNASTLLSTHAPLIISGLILDPSRITPLALAIRISNISSMPIYIFNATYAPKLSKFYNQRKLDSLEFYSRNSSLINSTLSISFSVIFLSSYQQATKILGTEYDPTLHVIFGVLSIGHIVNTITGSAGLLLNIAGDEKSHLKINLIISILLITSVYLSAQQGKILLVAISISTSMSIQNILLSSTLYVKHNIKSFIFIKEKK